MRKILFLLLLMLSTTINFAGSADLIQKLNLKVEGLKSELKSEMEKNGMKYQIVGSFSVEGDNIKIESYILPQVGEKLINRFNITEIRDRDNLEKLIKRETNLPLKASNPITGRDMAGLAGVLAALMLAGVTYYKLSRRKNNIQVTEKCSEKSEDKKAA